MMDGAEGSAFYSVKDGFLRTCTVLTRSCEHPRGRVVQTAGWGSLQSTEALGRASPLIKRTCRAQCSNFASTRRSVHASPPHFLQRLFSAVIVHFHGYMAARW